jgi:hypothetical protein
MKKLPLALLLSVQLVLTAHAQMSGMEIGVRSGIDNEEKARRDKDPAYAGDDHQRLRRYLLASIKEVKNDEKLVKPVDARAIAAELNKVLQAQGFRPVARGEKPEIIITVQYSRGMLLNPYLDPDKLSVEDFRHGKRGPANLSNTVPVTTIVTHDTFVGLEAKTQAMNYEKLAIEVSAMKYPPPVDPKQKPQLLWQTIMYTDDPDHRDLNAVMPKLLASGAPYFDKHIDRERELKSYSDLPEGKVNVGTPEVVAEPKK